MTKKQNKRKEKQKTNNQKQNKNKNKTKTKKHNKNVHKIPRVKFQNNVKQGHLLGASKCVYYDLFQHNIRYFVTQVKNKTNKQNKTKTNTLM